MIYYGDEAGMWGANDPCPRKPMLWNDLVYENEKVNPDQSLRIVEDENKMNQDLFEFYKKLIKIRNENKVLRLGTFKILLIDDEKNIYGFSREIDDKEIIVLLNKSNRPVNVKLDVNHHEYYSDLLNNNEIISAEGNKIDCNIKAISGRILN